MVFKFQTIPQVLEWCHTILPTIYDDSLSYLQMVARLKEVVNKCIDAINQLGNSNLELTEQYQKMREELAELQNSFDDFVAGYTIADGTVTIEKLASDVFDRLREIVEKEVHEVAKFVQFGLNDDGYFVAYIPESWSEIEFDTDSDGNLVLRY